MGNRFSSGFSLNDKNIEAEKEFALSIKKNLEAEKYGCVMFINQDKRDEHIKFVKKYFDYDENVNYKEN